MAAAWYQEILKGFPSMAKNWKKKKKGYQDIFPSKTHVPNKNDQALSDEIFLNLAWNYLSNILIR